MGRMGLNDIISSETDPEGNLQILSSPDVHACIIRANLLKIISIYREETTRHSGSPGETDTKEQKEERRG